MAIRKGPWKIHLITQDAYGPGAREPKTQDPPLLFNLGIDPGEKLDVAEEHPDVLKDLLGEIMTHKKQLTPAESQLETRL